MSLEGGDDTLFALGTSSYTVTGPRSCRAKICSVVAGDWGTAGPGPWGPCRGSLLQHTVSQARFLYAGGFSTAVLGGCRGTRWRYAMQVSGAPWDQNLVNLDIALMQMGGS